MNEKEADNIFEHKHPRRPFFDFHSDAEYNKYLADREARKLNWIEGFISGYNKGSINGYLEAQRELQRYE